MKYETPNKTYWLMPQEHWMFCRLSRSLAEDGPKNRHISEIRNAYGPYGFMLRCAREGDRLFSSTIGLLGLMVLMVTRTEGILGLLGYLLLTLAFCLAIAMFVRTSQRRTETALFRVQQQLDNSSTR